MMKRLLSLIIIVFFLPWFLMMYLILIFSPLMAVSDIFAVINYEAPKDNLYFVMLFLISFTLWLSLRVPSFRKIYTRYPFLWPFSQMLFISLVGLAFGLFFMNLWAEDEILSKPFAILLAFISFFLVRAFMSYWFKKYPISIKMFK
ncbi:hypothetical protein M3182_01210 [Mesobacillus maritimus]|uniref:hypothetical protein n=1 Tax=Mesobacillus maritimus TaxID=1643336 RepID=UPI00203EED06|nr:hypothetical protein [Mesobacillus maritimus]MCM3584358.1 hypothetical protein [Mesobacillus maritimus]MCM3669224.1 hypothetical protein [Mesobacillus maritimus]